MTNLHTLPTVAAPSNGTHAAALRPDALEVIHRIIDDERVAVDFFFVKMAPKMNALAASYSRSLGLDIYPEDVAREAYLSCQENNWAKLRAFQGKTTPASWISRLASQATYRLALSEIKHSDNLTSFQPWHDRIDEDGDISDNQRLLRETLEELYKKHDCDDNVRCLIDFIISSLGWSYVQEEVWRERFFNETPSKELALRFNVRRSWIDNTYSRLNKQFRKAAKAWWDKYNS